MKRTYLRPLRSLCHPPRRTRVPLPCPNQTLLSTVIDKTLLIWQVPSRSLILRIGCDLVYLRRSVEGSPHTIKGKCGNGMDPHLRQISLGRCLRLKGMLDITSIFTFLLVFPVPRSAESIIRSYYHCMSRWFLVTPYFCISVFVAR